MHHACAELHNARISQRFPYLQNCAKIGLRGIIQVVLNIKLPPLFWGKRPLIRARGHYGVHLWLNSAATL